MFTFLGRPNGLPVSFLGFFTPLTLGGRPRRFSGNTPPPAASFFGGRPDNFIKELSFLGRPLGLDEAPSNPMGPSLGERPGLLFSPLWATKAGNNLVVGGLPRPLLPTTDPVLALGGRPRPLLTTDGVPSTRPRETNTDSGPTPTLMGWISTLGLGGRPGPLLGQEGKAFPFPVAAKEEEIGTDLEIM